MGVLGPVPEVTLSVPGSPGMALVNRRLNGQRRCGGESRQKLLGIEWHGIRCSSIAKVWGGVPVCADSSLIRITIPG